MLILRTGLIATALACATIQGMPRALAQDESDQLLGHVHFDTSCNDVAQRRFDRAMRYQHSFWYREAREIYLDAAKADESCAIAFWGVALTYLDNPHNPIPDPNLASGLAAIDRAVAIGAKSERERDYIDALALMYRDYATRGHAQRIRAYLDAMEKLAAKYPADDEAQIFYAITLNTSASPTDKTYAQQKKGAAILEPIWKREPQHPGIAHYLIHLYDYPALATEGLEAAKKYARIAPDAPHAQHMPSHIFTRVGDWQGSIDANRRSAAAAVLSKEPADGMHAGDYTVYAELQLGRDEEAAADVDAMGKIQGYSPKAFGAHFGLAAARARYMTERADWRGAAQLAAQQNEFPQVMAITYFARALGAARSGQVDAAKGDLAKVAEMREALKAAKVGYWPSIVDIQYQVANAWILDAEGKTDEALTAMRTAAEAEDKTEKSPVTPGPLAPARELYGQMLLAHGKAKEAVEAFAATMAKEPNRFNGYLGAAQAAAKFGDKANAKANYQKLLALTAGAGAGRAEVVAAKAYVADN
jgi:hypothetical protein